MRRRDFICLCGGAVTGLPFAARGQQATMPVIGFLHSGTSQLNANRLVGFRKGLSDAGFVENENVTIEYRWADGQNGRLPELAADLVRRKVAVIVAVSSQPATLAAKARPRPYRLSFPGPATRLPQGWSPASVGRAAMPPESAP
jgi:putative tryptophan/tyrosine transport system substrate-binding protein